MRVRHLDPDQADLDAWQHLADTAATPNPFFEPGFVMAAVRYLPDGDRVRLAVVEGPDGWLAALPTLGSLRWRGVPALVRGAWAHDYGALGAPLAVDGETGMEALRTLFGALRRRSGFVALDWLPADGAAVLAAEDAGSVVRWRRFERAQLVRRPDDDYLQGRISSRRRRRYRQQLRQLGEAHGEVTTVDDEAAVDALLALEMTGWKAQEGTAMVAAGHAPMLREAATAFAARGRLQGLVLRAGDRPVAAQVNFVAQDTLFCFKTAFDAELSRFSPGVLLELEAIRVFHERPELNRMDSCADPDNALINGLWPDRLALEHLLIAGAGALGQAGRAQAVAMTAIRDRREQARDDDDDDRSEQEDSPT